MNRGFITKMGPRFFFITPKGIWGASFYRNQQLSYSFVLKVEERFVLIKKN